MTLYHTYPLLNCKGHIQLISNYSTIDVEKENNRANKYQVHIQYTENLYYIIGHLPAIKL